MTYIHGVVTCGVRHTYILMVMVSSVDVGDCLGSGIGTVC